MDIFTNLSVQMNQAINAVDLRENDMDLINLHLMVNGKMDDMSFDDALRVAAHVSNLTLSAQAGLWGDFSITEREYLGLESGIINKIGGGVKKVAGGIWAIIKKIWLALKEGFIKIGKKLGFKWADSAEKQLKVDKMKVAFDSALNDLEKELDDLDDIDESELEKIVRDAMNSNDVGGSVKTDVVVEGTSPIGTVIEVEFSKETAPRGSIVVEETENNVIIQTKNTEITKVINEALSAKTYKIDASVFKELETNTLIKNIEKSLEEIEQFDSGLTKKILLVYTQTGSTDTIERELYKEIKNISLLKPYLNNIDDNAKIFNQIMDNLNNQETNLIEIVHGKMSPVATKLDFSLFKSVEEIMQEVVAAKNNSIARAEVDLTAVKDAGQTEVAKMAAISLDVTRVVAKCINLLLTRIIAATNVCSLVITDELTIVNRSTVVVTNVPPAKRKTQRGKRGKKK